MTLAWSPEAIDDLASLRAYIGVEDPAAAKRIALARPCGYGVRPERQKSIVV
jgi:hypothetical protein